MTTSHRDAYLTIRSYVLSQELDKFDVCYVEKEVRADEARDRKKKCALVARKMHKLQFLQILITDAICDV